MTLKSFQDKEHPDKRPPGREFKANDLVWYRRSEDDEWSPGKVVSRSGPLSYCVEDAMGVPRWMRANQLRIQEVPEPQIEFQEKCFPARNRNIPNRYRDYVMF